MHRTFYLMWQTKIGQMNCLHYGSIAVLNTMAINNLGRKLNFTAHFPICLHTKLTSTELFQFTTQVTSRQELVKPWMTAVYCLFLWLAQPTSL